MELDLSSITGEDIAQVTVEQTSTQQTQQSQQKPKFNGGQQLNLWNDANVPVRKIEFLKYEQTVDSFTFYFNERTNNLPEKQIEKIKAVIKILIDKKGNTFRLGLKRSDIVNNILSAVDDGSKFQWYTLSKGYNPEVNDIAVAKGNNKEAFGIVRGFHKSYDKLPGFVRALCAKDVEVLLGPKLDKAVGCVLVYTPCGAEVVTKDFNYEVNGQVGFVMRLAKELKIPVFNINSPTFAERFGIYVKENRYVSATAYKVAQGGNDHTDGGKVSEDLNTPKEEKKETTTNSVEVTENIDDQLFN